ncbi:unnamed protein product [Adineta steineri]|uniref:HAT C-terminal dimerisation domain-containing protein n=1 Tax=Adineta steineri TaxID=433720 RepID=A0A819EFX8_9BILA|nr:unnamed protein product [Adineta steineri]
MNTYLYNRLSGSKRFKQHADKCFPLVKAITSSSITFSSSKQTTLNNMGFTKGIKVTEDDVTKIKDLSVKRICGAIRYFSILDDSGFRNLAQEFVRLGVVYRIFDITSASRGEKTISRHTMISERSLTICPDYWMGSYKKISCLGVTAGINDDIKEHSDEELSQCHKYVHEQLKIIRNAQSSSKTLQQTADPHPKRCKTADSIFARFGDDYSHGFRENDVECFGYESDGYGFSEKQFDEQDRYLVMQIDKLSVTDNSLDFCRSYLNQYPLLSKLAKHVYSILATSTNVERLFPSAGLLTKSTKNKY